MRIYFITWHCSSKVMSSLAASTLSSSLMEDKSQKVCNKLFESILATWFDHAQIFFVQSHKNLRPLHSELPRLAGSGLGMGDMWISGSGQGLKYNSLIFKTETVMIDINLTTVGMKPKASC